MKKLLCLALLVSAGSIYSESISANNKPTDNKSGNNSKDIYKKTWIDFNKNGIKDVYEDPSAPIEARIADLLSQMTLEEKTCQMATLYGSGRVPPASVMQVWRQRPTRTPSTMPMQTGLTIFMMYV